LWKQARGRWPRVMPAAIKTGPYWLDPSDPHRTVAARQGLITPSIAQWQVFNRASAQVIAEQVWPRTEANVTQNGMTPEQAVDAAIRQIRMIFEKIVID
jgi:multiple sugar transport system substrate-binding protein